MYKLFLILRYLRKRRIAMFAVVSVWLCVAMVLIVISVMGGFLDMVKERSRGLLGDLVLDNSRLEGLPYYEEWMEFLRQKMPERVVMATPVIYNYGILRVGPSYTQPIRIVAIRLHEYARVNDFENSLFYDKYYTGTTSLEPQTQPMVHYDEQMKARLPEDIEKSWDKYRALHPNAEESKRGQGSGYAFPGPGRYRRPDDQFREAFAGDPDELIPGLVIGCDLVNERAADGSYIHSLPRGMEVRVTLLPISLGAGLRLEDAIVKKFRYADDSRTRVFEIDKLCVYADFGLIQELLRMDPQEREDGSFTPARASQVLIKLAPGLDATRVRSEVQDLWREFCQSLPPLGPTEYELLKTVTIETWEQRQAPFIAAVEKEKVLVTILFALISLVAVVLIGCIFYMIVEKKTKDIGIVKSVGATSRGVAGIFIGYGAAVGVVGAFLGTVSAIIFVRYINEIQGLLAKLNPKLRVWSPEVYTFDRIPNVVKFQEAGVIVLIAIIAAMLGALLPAVLAARIWPVDALRYE
ncbi:MAG TPA: FtsX-like permease family protein, partial [Phycisphaerae bacterium]